MIREPIPKVFREKAARQPIAKVSARHDATWWPKQAEKVRELQGGVCAMCLKDGDLDACHIIALERTAYRHDKDHPLNQIDNLLAMHRFPCHQHFDAQSKAWRRAKGAELKARLDGGAGTGHGARRTGGTR